MPRRNDPPHYISHHNLSIAWAQAFLSVWQYGDISCLTVSVGGFKRGQVQEDSRVRELLEGELLTAGNRACHTVANTIFPRSLWNPAKPASALYERYAAISGQLRRDRSSNQYGTYFDRMVSYGDKKFNQIQYILETWHSGNHRSSALQLLTLNPYLDDTHQRRRGFPCLSQISLGQATKGYMTITAYYPMQYIFERAYGNYLGIARLGEFFAHELGLQLTRMNCIAVVARRDQPKRKSGGLVEALTKLVQESPGTP